MTGVKLIVTKRQEGPVILKAEVEVTVKQLKKHNTRTGQNTRRNILSLERKSLSITLRFYETYIHTQKYTQRLSINNLHSYPQKT